MNYIIFLLSLALLARIIYRAANSQPTSGRIWDLGFMQPKVVITAETIVVTAFGLVRISCYLSQVESVRLVGGFLGDLEITTVDSKQKIGVPSHKGRTAEMVLEMNEYIAALSLSARLRSAVAAGI